MRVRPYARFKPRVGCSVNLFMITVLIGVLSTSLIRRIK